MAGPVTSRKESFKRGANMAGERVLVLGITGMLGHALFNRLSRSGEYEVFGTARGGGDQGFVPQQLNRVYGNIDAQAVDSLLAPMAEVKPDVVLNCIGIVKQLPAANDPVTSIKINSLLPHRLALLCKAAGARFIHFSTDCVFSGSKGGYSEQDRPDAGDLYGRTKLLGEVSYPDCLTIRTSIIGHELKGKHGLLEWFLAQAGTVKGFTKAIFTGFPTLELARIIAEYVIPNPDLTGIYHISSQPIAKYNLLQLVAKRYSRDTVIEPCSAVCLDRSLDSSLFRGVSGYSPPSWTELVNAMYEDFVVSPYYHRG